MNAEHLDMQTPDGAQLNIDALYKICPSCFTESKGEDGALHHAVDFNKLRSLLGDMAVDDAPESYDFTWVGKREAQREANARINKTLRPCVEESVDWDKTQNLYIEGDNLEVLKLLQNSYMGKVKMIYIDPPYNTGSDFVYHDDFKISADEYDENNINEDGERFRRNTDSNGRFHSDWCSMMYSRLMVARTLLSDDGVIFISIDDNEVENLKKICNEIFGESNNMSPFIWSLPRGINAGLIARAHEYVLCITKNAFIRKNFNRIDSEVDYSVERCNKKIDSRHPESIIEFKEGIRYEGKDKEIEGIIDGSERITIIGKLVFKNGKLAEPVKLSAGWTMKNMIIDWMNGQKVYDLKGQPIIEFFFKENGRLYSKKEMQVLSIKSILKDVPDTQIARKQMEELFGSQDIFSYPKPIELSSLLAKLCTNHNDVILDFFSGSATTAHAVMKLNSEDGGKRRFIMVQLLEETPEDSEAYKAGFKDICEIGKERIRRAGKKIKEENPDAKDLDTGFRVLKCDYSNMKDVYFSPQDYNQTMLFDLLDNIKDDRTDLDLLFDCMLRWGVELSMPIDSSKKVDGCTIHNVNDGDLVACFNGEITDNVIDAIAELHPLRVVFRDSSFKEASQKMNLFELFKQKCNWSDAEVKNNVRVI